MTRKLVLPLAVMAVLIPSTAYAHHVFDDVDDNRFYAEPVEWAFNNNITTGKNATTFDPGGAVTRGEAVTFLKRYHDNIAANLNTDTLTELSCGEAETLLDEGDWTCGTTGVASAVAGAITSTLHESSTADVRYASVAIGHDGNPVIAFRNRGAAFDDIGIVVCFNPDCSESQRREVPTDDIDGYYTSIAIGHDGNPIIAHKNNDEKDLAFYVCDDPLCSSGTHRVVSTPVEDGGDTSIAIGHDGNPIVSHKSESDLAIYSCSNPTCSAGTNRVISTSDDDGNDTSITIRPDGKPIISVQNNTHSDLFIYACSTSSCSSGTYHQVETAPKDGWDSSITIGADGNPIVSHNVSDSSSELGVFACTVPDCSTGTPTVHERDGHGGLSTSIAIAPDGTPIIVHQTSDRAGVFVCTTPDCSTGVEHVIHTVETTEWMQMAIGPNGRPLIAGTVGTDDNLGAIAVRMHPTRIEVVAP